MFRQDWDSCMNIKKDGRWKCMSTRLLFGCGIQGCGCCVTHARLAKVHTKRNYFLRGGSFWLFSESEFCSWRTLSGFSHLGNVSLVVISSLNVGLGKSIWDEFRGTMMNESQTYLCGSMLFVSCTLWHGCFVDNCVYWILSPGLASRMDTNHDGFHTAAYATKGIERCRG